MLNIVSHKKLTNKESEIAKLVSQGKSNTEIANQLYISRDTVRSHLKSIYRKMNFDSSAAASSHRLILAVEQIKKSLQK